MEGKSIEALALEMMRKRGISIGEVYLLDTKGTTISVNEGVVERLEIGKERGASFRVFEDGRLCFSYTTALSSQGLCQAIERAVNSAKHTTPDEANDLPRNGEELPSVLTYDPQQEAIPVEEKIEFARQIERYARQHDPRITKFRESAYIDALGKIFIASTLGLHRSYRFSHCVGYSVPVAVEGGSAQTGFESDHALALPSLSAERIGQGAAAMAVAKLGARSYGTRRVDLVLDPRVTAGLFGALAPALYADNVLKGKSLFAHKLGEAVATEHLTLIDDGALEGGGRAAPIDGEGVATGETPLIREGILTYYLHSTYTARKMGAQLTGNSIRSSYHSPPRVGSTNLYPKPGNLGREELLAGVTDGLYISEVMGLHTVNPISGEYSLGALGQVIARGELTEPVEGIAIAGNVLDLLGSVMAVASDLRLFYHGGGGATVLLEGVSVSGK